MYRIIKNEQDNRVWYTVQEKWWFFWSTLTYSQGLPSGCIGSCPSDYAINTYDYSFESVKEAEEFIKQRSG